MLSLLSARPLPPAPPLLSLPRLLSHPTPLSLVPLVAAGRWRLSRCTVAASRTATSSAPTGTSNSASAPPTTPSSLNSTIAAPVRRRSSNIPTSGSYDLPYPMPAVLPCPAIPPCLPYFFALPYPHALPYPPAIPHACHTPLPCRTPLPCHAPLPCCSPSGRPFAPSRSFRSLPRADDVGKGPAVRALLPLHVPPLVARAVALVPRLPSIAHRGGASHASRRGGRPATHPAQFRRPAASSTADACGISAGRG